MLNCSIIYNLLIIEHNVYVSPENSFCMLPSGNNIMRYLPTVIWKICNSVHSLCPPDYPFSVLSFHDRMLKSNGKGRNFREGAGSTIGIFRDYSCIFGVENYLYKVYILCILWTNCSCICCPWLKQVYVSNYITFQ